MKKLSLLLLPLMTAPAFAHDSFMPHQHPHGDSMLLDANVVGVVALIAGLAVIAVMKWRRG